MLGNHSPKITCVGETDFDQLPFQWSCWGVDTTEISHDEYDVTLLFSAYYCFPIKSAVHVTSRGEGLGTETLSGLGSFSLTIASAYWWLLGNKAIDYSGILKGFYSLISY